jgi:hypothetical protein
MANAQAMNAAIVGLVGVAWCLALAASQSSKRAGFPRSLADLFLLTVASCHIFPEVLFLAFGPSLCRYRDHLRQDSIDSWGLLLASCLVLFSLGVVSASYAFRQRAGRTDALPLPRGYAWILLTILLWAYMWSGGLWSGIDGRITVLGGIAGTMLPIVSCLGMAQVGTHFTNPYLATSLGSFALVLSGSRYWVAQVFVMSVVLLNRLGCWKGPRPLISALILVVFVIVLISAIRATGNRFEHHDPAEQKFDRLLAASDSGIGRPASEWISDDFGYRFDCNSFPALVLQSQISDPPRPKMSFEVLETSLLALTPSMLLPEKLSMTTAILNEEERICLFYGIAPDDYLPSASSSLLALAGWQFLLMVAFVWGFLLALLDRLVCRPVRGAIVLYVGLCVMVTEYTANLQGMVVFTRTALPLWIFVIGFEILSDRRALNGRKSSHVSDTPYRAHG